MLTKRPELHRLCGLRDAPANGTSWHEAVLAGLAVRSVRATARALGVSPEDLAELIDFPADELGAFDSRLPPHQSNSLYRIALAFTRTVLKTGGNLEAAACWLRTEQPTLKGYIPILLLRSHVGAEYVFTAIERMVVPVAGVIRSEEAPDAGTVDFEHRMAGDAGVDDEDEEERQYEEDQGEDGAVLFDRNGYLIKKRVAKA